MLIRLSLGRLAVTTTLCLLVGCAKRSSLPAGEPDAFELRIEPRGAICPGGGTVVVLGIDRNRDGRVQPTEEVSRRAICASEAKPSDSNAVRLLLETVTLDPGNAQCPAGGTLLRWGNDENGNKRLDPSERDGSLAVCRPGPANSGFATLFRSAPLPPGVPCPAGGAQLERGPDLNRNDVLDGAEVQGVDYLCHGPPGRDGMPGRTSLLRSSPVEPGEPCPGGGVLVQHGLDANGDGVLTDDEVQGGQYVCHGVDGRNGRNGLSLATRTQPEPPGPSCPHGGTRIEFGLDQNADGILDDDEVTQTAYACNGAPGAGAPDAGAPDGPAPDDGGVEEPGFAPDTCARALQDQSTFGCEFWAADLPNAIEPQAVNDHPFAVLVQNPHAFPVAVTLDDGDDTFSEFLIEANQTGTMLPQSLGFPDHSIGNGRQQRAAYRLTASAPVAAYQVNGLQGAPTSSGGSLLLPTHGLGTSYRALTLPTYRVSNPGPEFSGYVTIVATANGTTVTVAPMGAVAAADDDEGIAIGDERTFVLDAHQAVTLRAAGGPAAGAGADLSGTSITSSHPVAVFSGHEATPGSAGFLDHIEEQVPPQRTLASEYVVGLSRAPGSGPQDILRIVNAGSGSAMIVTTPPVQPGCTTLSPGAFCLLPIVADVEIQSTEPLLVAHVSPGPDAAFAFATPVLQFRREHAVVIPGGFPNVRLTIVARPGPLELDGQPVAGSLALQGYQIARVPIPVSPVQGSTHRVSCAAGCSVEVHADDQSSSLAFSSARQLWTSVP